jgi:peptidoglycan/LPS O-acetylase OafA/YrhL
MAALAEDDAPPIAPARAAESVRSEVGHIAPMDGVRGIAVLWVVLFHVVALRGTLDDPWARFLGAFDPLRSIAGAGYLGVDLFFLISGFLLTLPWFVHAAKGAPPPSAREFYARRFWRIAPAYYVQLVALFVIVLPLLKGATYWRSDLYVYIWNFFAHAAFLHNTTPLTSGSMEVNGPLWTLAVEAQYYALLPLAALAFVRAPLAALVVSVAVAVLWQLSARYDLDALVAAQMALGEHWHWTEPVVRKLLQAQLPSYLAHFALGIVLGRAWLSWRSRAHSAAERAMLHVALAISLAALYWFVAVDGRVLGDYSWLVPAVSLAAFLFWAAASEGRITRDVLGRGPLAFTGRVSYSMYLYHVPLLLLWNAYAGFIPRWVSLPLYLAALFALSWLSWCGVEQPFLRRRRA